MPVRLFACWPPTPTRKKSLKPSQTETASSRAPAGDWDTLPKGYVSNPGNPARSLREREVPFQSAAGRFVAKIR
jgi:hypothetical protein